LNTDAERARHVRKRVREMRNSRGEWEKTPPVTARPLRDICVSVTDAAVVQSTIHNPQLVPALSVPAALEKVGTGVLCVLSESDKIYGRSVTVAEHLNNELVLLVKWVRRLTNWHGRQAPLSVWASKIVPLIEKRFAQLKTPVVRFENQQHKILALVSLAELSLRVPVDSHGVAIWKPAEREVLPVDCAVCWLVETCRRLSMATGVAMLWRRLGLVAASGAPARRGEIASYFSQGDGLAIAAGLEDPSYPIEEFIYDIANLDAGFRFCGEENRWAGRLAIACQQIYGMQTIPGYLENGVSPGYGAGAEQIVASIHKNPLNKSGWITETLGAGDIDRVIIEWRSLLRQITHAPKLEWSRWQEFQALAKSILNETESPTLTELPPLGYDQTKRIDHRLVFRRH